MSGYESGNREPSIATVAKILDILDVDANYLYQDEVEKITNVVINIEEKTILEKYREHLMNMAEKWIVFTLGKRI